MSVGGRGQNSKGEATISTRAFNKFLILLPIGVLGVCIAAIAYFFRLDAKDPAEYEERVALEQNIPTVEVKQMANSGTLTPGKGKPSALPGSWPQFRGPQRDGIARPQRKLAKTWPAGGPTALWSVDLGPGHAGAAVHKGRVYVMDYDRTKEEDVVRCLSFDTGEEIWRYAYSASVKYNHGMSRTVSAVTDDYVVTLGPKCHVHCLKAATGELVWKKDLVKENGTVVPLWYGSQCPLIDGDKVILAPGAKPLMMAVELATGKVVWEANAPNMDGMTYSSILPIEFKGQRQYVYWCNNGVVGVAAKDGKVLWTKPDWKIKDGNVPSPVWAGDDRLFFCGGYGVGACMVRLESGADGKITPKELYRLKPAGFGSEQHTPIFYDGYLYGVDPRQNNKTKMVCLNPANGQRVWTSGTDTNFDLGPYLICDGVILALDGETGTLFMLQASSSGYKELAKAKVLSGRFAWAPMALVEGRLLLRDETKMICLDLGA